MSHMVLARRSKEGINGPAPHIGVHWLRRLIHIAIVATQVTLIRHMQPCSQCLRCLLLMDRWWLGAIMQKTRAVKETHNLFNALTGQMRECSRYLRDGRRCSKEREKRHS